MPFKTLRARATGWDQGPGQSPAEETELSPGRREWLVQGQSADSPGRGVRGTEGFPWRQLSVHQ